jgi:hypothetical protein
MGKSTQLELPISRSQEPDRNFEKGGRSFYFFDFDDNVAFLTTAIFLRHRVTDQEIQISSREFAQQSAFIGKEGLYADYTVDPDAKAGSFRCFRDRDFSWMERMVGRRQMFVEDLASALGMPDLHWKGPSWNCFYHAVFNARPVALITARGHHPNTMVEGIRLWVEEGHLPYEPNYLALYPVSHPEIKKQLGLPESHSVPHLKQKALREAVARAKQVYGDNPHHRFGMSDDDPRNIEWITREMRELKYENPKMSFFIIQTHGEHMVKSEIFADRVEDQILASGAQLKLFDE